MSNINGKMYESEFEEAVIELLIKLGAHTEPYIQQVNYLYEYSLPSRLKQLLNKITFYEFIRIEDYDLVGFEEAAYKYNRINKEISILLWNIIIPKYMNKQLANLM